MRTTLVIVLFVTVSGLYGVAAQQSAPAPWQQKPQVSATREPWQYEPGPTAPSAPRFEYEPGPTPSPSALTAPFVQWMKFTTGDIYLGSEILTKSPTESFSIASELDADALRANGLLLYREVHTIPGTPSRWLTRAGVSSMYSASIEGNDGYVVVLRNGSRVSLMNVVNVYGAEIDARAATDYMEGVARLGLSYRPSDGFVMVLRD